MPANSRRIAKNTVMLYVRMLLMMAVTLYTSRVILDVLGVDDYGIYSLVAGFVTLFAFVSQALNNAIQRYLNIALGKGNKQYFQSIFSTSINIFLLLSLIVLMVGETFGIWFVNTQLNVAVERMSATRWVFHFSILVFIFSMIRVPYNAAIIAHEEMGFYAFISIIEVLLRLGVVFLLQFFDYDKLILYAVLYFVTILIVNAIYHLYCLRMFKECKYVFIWDKRLFKELLSFSGWSLIGQVAVIGRSQGENFLINHYHSVAVNAAQGVSNQVTGAVNQFVSNFQTAFNPQLIQTYAAGEMKEHVLLLYRACKFSYLLLFILVIPVASNIDIILSTWLTVVPQYSREFCIVGLGAFLLLALSSPLTTTVYAHGDIKKYNISIALTHTVGLIMSFVVLKIGLAPYSIAVVSVFVQIFILIIRLYYSSRICPIGLIHFFKDVIVPIAVVSLLSLILPIVIYIMSSGFNFWETVGICIVEVLWVAGITYVIGLNKNEKQFVLTTIRKTLHKE